MSTNMAISQNTITQQSRPTIYDNVRTALGSLIPIDPNINNGTARAWSYPVSRPAVYAASDKAVEANRQVERMKSLKSICAANSPAHECQLESIASSIGLIGSFLTSIFPIPVASSGSDDGTTLFFSDDQFYGDLEIRGKIVEYYIKTVAHGNDVEIFDSEEIEDGYIPTRLLTSLYTHYAR